MQIMSPRPSRRWWLYLIASAYLLTLCFNVWVVTFGPASPGLLYSVIESSTAWPSFEIERVALGSPLEQAGARAGDVIESVGGHTIAGQTDWFVARANFELDHPIGIQVRRGEEHLRLSFTITKRNWRTVDAGIVA